MEVAIVAAVLGAIVLIVYLSKRLNTYSDSMYGYRPIGFATVFLAMIPYVLLGAGLIFRESDPANLEWGIIFGVLSVIGLFMWIKQRSDTQVAFGATILLLIAGLPSLLILILFLNRDGDDYYYYDD